MPLFFHKGSTRRSGKARCSATFVQWHLAITKDGESRLSHDTECTQTYATTRSEQVMLVPIGAPPYNHVELNFIVSIAYHSPFDELYRP